MVGAYKITGGIRAMNIQLTKRKEVYNYCEPYIIAELGSNHNGDMDMARRMIAAAKKSGADCVKFQSWSKDTIFSKKVYEDNYFLTDDYRKRKNYSLEQIVDKFAIREKDMEKMKRFADSIGIDCISTPFSGKEVDFLAYKLRVSFIKVASMDLNNYPFLAYIAKRGLPVVLSTGLSSLSEIDNAIRTIENAGNNRIVILHCVSLYPPKDREVNLNNIDTLRKLYPYPIGFSDHTLGTSIPLAAVAKGVCIIEKHFTLDKNYFGWDHKISATPDEMKVICGESKRINKALGSYRILCEEGDKRKEAFRRSIVAGKTIKKGTIIGKGCIDFKRPGSGIQPEYEGLVIGRKAKKDIPYDKIIELNDLV